jgi:hypothetical protein
MTAERKAPTWGMVVGILGICFGALGLMGGGYELMMPMMMSMQKKMMEGMRQSVKERPQASAEEGKQKAEAPKVDPEAVFKTMEDFMSGPPWYEKFSYINGGMQLLLSALYILASAFLLLARRGAATFFIWVAAISALRSLTAVVVGLSAGSFLAFWSVASGTAGLAIDLVLIAIVAVSDRSPYRTSATSRSDS